MKDDFSLTKNLANEQGAKLKEMQALFMQEAEKYHVLPIDDRTIERMNPAQAGRPDVLGDRKSLTLYEGMQGMLENTFMNIKNRSSKITAELDVPARANGVILSQGGRFGGWSLYVKDGKPAYIYNFLGLSRYTIASPQLLPAGTVTVTLDFAYDGGGPGKGGNAIFTSTVNQSPKDEWRRRSPISSRLTRPPMSASTIRLRWPRHRHRPGDEIHRQDQQGHAGSEVGDTGGCHEDSNNGHRRNGRVHGALRHRARPSGLHQSAGRRPYPQSGRRRR